MKQIILFAESWKEFRFSKECFFFSSKIGNQIFNRNISHTGYPLESFSKEWSQITAQKINRDIGRKRLQISRDIKSRFNDQEEMKNNQINSRGTRTYCTIDN